MKTILDHAILGTLEGCACKLENFLLQNLCNMNKTNSFSTRYGNHPYSASEYHKIFIHEHQISFRVTWEDQIIEKVPFKKLFKSTGNAPKPGD